MNLSPTQQAAVDAIVEWIKHGDRQIFVLAGFAGTGKTTIVRWIIEQFEDTVQCLAPTGKAVSVLMSKLPSDANVSTVHSFLYRPLDINLGVVREQEERVAELEADLAGDPELSGQLFLAQREAARLRKKFERGTCDFLDAPKWSPVAVVDEASMVDEKMEGDLRRAADKILFVGDPSQLPPVNGAGFFVRNRPDVLLTEVHRQALDSPVLRLATMIRNGEVFQDWDDLECRLVRGELPVNELSAGDVVLTGMNETRRRLNRALRDFRGKTTLYPDDAETLICLRNDPVRGLINGITARTKGATRLNDDLFRILRGDLHYEGRFLPNVKMDPYHFELYEQPDLKRGDIAPSETQWDFGYAITVHKAQGSEWPHVIVWDDKMRAGDVVNRRRWLYTAITRAQHRLTLVVPK